MSLPHIILTLLHQNPATGYDITKQFSSTVGFFWKASHQQVYRELNKMAELNWVSHTIEPQSGKPDRKVYTITTTGSQQLSAWLAEPLQHPTTRDECGAKFYATLWLNSAAFQSQLQQLITQTQDELNQLAEQERTTYVVTSKLNTQQRIERLTLKRHQLSLDAWLNWAQEVLIELNQR